MALLGTLWQQTLLCLQALGSSQRVPCMASPCSFCPVLSQGYRHPLFAS